ncbi:MAG: Glycosyl transferase, group 1 [uncultured Corynebacteriales bacterium]|uniref:Glycosyl transferase, group 1 n=1 Tax=uncultured Mycobacteriales bacterium TaxID=581187 RepID=A0A6J4J4Q7_9ACTN|nr:MAG: Glycosyl transferase, group 1 [uncultured Corynebacteriales bacterium]
MRILAFGTYDVRSHPRIGVLLEGLRAAGDDVVEVNVPLGIDTAGRVAMLRQPWRLPLLAYRLARCWALLALRGRRAFRAHRPDAVLVGYLGHFDVVLARLLFRRATIVLDHLIFAADTAADRGEAPGAKLRLLGALDRRALRSADVVVVDSDEHAAMVPADLADRAVVVPVGAPAAWFAAGPAPRPDPDVLSVVFFGLFTPLQGTPTIGRALGLLAADPRIRVTMIGTGQDRPEAQRLAAANTAVTWRDWVPAEDLPAVVAAHDVCLGIVGAGPKARRVVPNKVYQGAAAGCAVVTSDTRPQRAALGDAAVFVPAADPPALAAALRELADDPPALRKLRDAARDRAREQFAPAAVVGTLRARLTSIPGSTHR